MLKLGRPASPKTWKGKRGAQDLLTPIQAEDALGHNITAQNVRKLVRRGHLRCYWKRSAPGSYFVKRGEVLAYYEQKIRRHGWKGVKR